MTRILVALLAAAAFLPAQTKEEKKFLLDNLQSSLKTVEGSLKGLSDAQFTFKPAPDRWSIAECAEHIAATEPFLRGMIVNQVLKAPAPPKRSTNEDDVKMLAMIGDRSKRASAPGEIAPKGQYKSPEEALKALRAARKETIAWLKSNKEDLRAHYGEQFKTDAYQSFLLIAGHTVRHTKQMEEVKQQPNYPK